MTAATAKMPPAESTLAPSKSSQELHDNRWRPVNSLKNSRLTIQIHCTDTDKRFNIPEQPIQSAGNLQNYFDEAAPDDGHILGSTTLQELMNRVKKNIPSLYLMKQVGGASLTCGNHNVHQDEWDTTMVCELVCEDKQKTLKGTIPRVKLDDGREAVVVTIGAPNPTLNVQRSVVDRCLSKGDVYG